MSPFSLLLLAHVLFATTGYAGLIGSNVWLFFLSRGGDAATIRAGLTTWRKSSRIFGPLLGLGILLGFGLASTLHVPLASSWLIVTYLLIVIAVAIQAGVMVPWQHRSDGTMAAGAIPSTAPIAVVLASQSLAYTAILGLMLTRPV